MCAALTHLVIRPNSEYPSDENTLFYIKYQLDIISLQVECIKQIFELCMHIQNISDKTDFIRSFNFRVKRFDITTQQHIGYIKYVQTFINTM